MAKRERAVLMTPEQVESRFQISRSTQASLRSRGQIPFIQLSTRMPRYREDELLDWLASKSVAAGPVPKKSSSTDPVISARPRRRS